MKIQLFNNRQVIAFFLMGCLVFCLSKLSIAQQDQYKDAATKLVTDFVANEKVKELKGQTIVISEFTPTNGKKNTVARMFQEKLTTALIKADLFDVIARGQLDKALQKYKIDCSKLSNLEVLKKVGKLINSKYIIIGSISEEGGLLSFDARIVVMQTGKLIAAADACITVPAIVNPTQNPSPIPVTGNQPSTAVENGTYLGDIENGGIVGGGKFKLAWKNSIGKSGVQCFSAGNLNGDGKQKLVTIIVSKEIIGEGYYFAYRVGVWSWAKGKFNSVWESEGKQQIGSLVSPYVRIFTTADKCTSIISSYNDRTSWLNWEGTNYVSKPIDEIRTITDKVGDTTLGMVGLNSNNRLTFIKSSTEKAQEDKLGEQLKNFDVECNRYTCVTASDFDGDTEMEIANVNAPWRGELTRGDKPNPITIYGIDGKNIIQKAVTNNSYGGRLTWWKPAEAKYPYLVVSKNDVTTDDEKTKFSGGYVYLLQWNGEMYEEAWKSDRLEDEVLDIQVCDPKNEGKEGLVVLSQDKKGCYLSKFVIE